MIHWDLGKKCKLDHTKKWYLHNPESIVENETYKHFWKLDIQTDHLILARIPYQIIIQKKKRICLIVDFEVPANHTVKMNVSEKKDKYQDLARELKKLWNIKVTVIPIATGVFGTVTKDFYRDCRTWK